MSSLNNEDNYGLSFDTRSTNADFHKRLLDTRKETQDDVEDEIGIEAFGNIQSQAELQQEFDRLKAHVLRNETKIKSLERKLKRRQDKRKLEAVLTNMTPSERAEHIEKELKYMQDHDGEEEKEPEMDMLFDYIIFLSTDSAAGDLSKGDIIKEHGDIRERALQDQSVRKENEFMDVIFEEISNAATYHPESDTTTRKCHFSGTSSGKPFSVSFTMTEPAMVISDLMFDVGIEMQMDIGALLALIIKDCDLMAFFRTLIHYSKMEKQRKNTIERWKDEYRESAIMVDLLSETRLTFQDEGNDHLYLLLEWNIVENETNKPSVDADIFENVTPEFKLEAVTQLDDDNHETDRLTLELVEKIKDVGVFNGVNFFVRGILN